MLIYFFIFIIFWFLCTVDAIVLAKKKSKITGETLYYVRFPEWNYRYDKWVTRSEIKFVKKKTHGRQHRAMRDDSEIRNPLTTRWVDKVEFGKYEMDTWYFSFYPPDFSECDKLYVCEYCFKFHKYRSTLERHSKKCTLTCPPGNEIYRSENLSFWEVDGDKNKMFCLNLCMFAKMFLLHKLSNPLVEKFYFYVLTEYDEETGFHIVGFFSKLKDWRHGSTDKNHPDNLACILTIPCYQRKGYGDFLITFCNNIFFSFNLFLRYYYYFFQRMN